MKVDYAIDLLKNDLHNEVKNVFQLRHKVDPIMLKWLLEICHEIRNAIRLLSGENEIDVSASVEHDALHDVGGSHAEADDTSSNSDKEAVESALRKITDDGNLCDCQSPDTGHMSRPCPIHGDGF